VAFDGRPARLRAPNATARFLFGTDAFRIGFSHGLGCWWIRSTEKLTRIASRQIIAAMSGPAPVRRIKSYSAASGFVYQYQFHELHESRRGSAAGNEYIYYVSTDRKTMFPLRIFVRRDAVENWAKKNGRGLSGTEEYAIAKMRLFQAFDEVEGLSAAHTDLAVDDSNLETLFSQLNLD
jgi:hypothetical protein